MKIDDRKSWSFQFCQCWICGFQPANYQFKWLETHEIIGGPLRKFTVVESCMWFTVCNTCHAELPSCPRSSDAAWQLSLKRQHDPDHFDLERFIEVARRHTEWVTMDDIENAEPPDWARRFTDGGV